MTCITVKEFKELQAKNGRSGANTGLSKLLGDLTYSGVKFEREYQFNPERKFRFDIAFPEHRLAIEYEGIFSNKSRHTTSTGYTNDAEKYNLAQASGWRVLRYTAMNIKNAMNDLRSLKII